MHRKKINIASLFVLLIVISSCGVLNRSTTGSKAENAIFDGNRFSKEIDGYNISNNGFRIDRVRVEARIDGETTRFSGNLRYAKEGKLLFSARAIAGIELARIYIDRDVVIIIDRINRTYSKGSTMDFLKKYSVSWNDIVFIFGDLPEDIKFAGRVKCERGYANIVIPGGNRRMDITVDCLNRKISAVKVKEGNEASGTVFAEYRNIKNDNGVIYPGEVAVSYGNGKFELEIEYDRFSKYDGTVKQPGRPSGYDIIELK